MIHQSFVKIDSSQFDVPIGPNRAAMASPDLKDRRIECPSAEIVDNDPFIPAFTIAISQSCRGRLVYDTDDIQSRNRLAAIIHELMNRGTQVILVTHRLTEIPAGITHVLGVKNGQILLHGKREEILADETLKKLRDHGGKLVRLDAFAYLHKEAGKVNFFND